MKRKEKLDIFGFLNYRKQRKWYYNDAKELLRNKTAVVIDILTCKKCVIKEYDKWFIQCNRIM